MAVKALTKNKGGRPVGSKKSILPQVSADIGSMATPADIKNLIKRLAQHCIRNEISTLQTSALNGLLITWIRLHELSDVQKRLDALEFKISKSLKNGRAF